MSNLNVGDRVRVYEGTRVFTAEVRDADPKGPGFPGSVLVKRDQPCDGTGLALVHEKQCRRLRKREKRERVERWIFMDSNAREILCRTLGECESLGKRTDANVAYVRVGEVKEGERIFSRKDIEKAWEANAYTHTDANESLTLKALCKALGFEEEGE